MTDKEKRIADFKNYITNFAKLDNADELATKLDDMGYFTAPASAGHHGNREGGLFDHSQAVAHTLWTLTIELDLKWERPGSPYIIGMLHDLCKCDQYVRSEAEPDKWVYSNDQLLTGHGEKSVILAQKLLPLTEEEILCIRWHMGAFDDQKNWGAYSRAVENYPNVLWTHTADMVASHILGY